MGVLPQFQGKAIHDGWKSYQGYDCQHFLCLEHVPTDCQAIARMIRSLETLSGLPFSNVDTVDRTQISVADDTINKYEY